MLDTLMTDTENNVSIAFLDALKYNQCSLRERCILEVKNKCRGALVRPTEC